MDIVLIIFTLRVSDLAPVEDLFFGAGTGGYSNLKIIEIYCIYKLK